MTVTRRAFGGLSLGMLAGRAVSQPAEQAKMAIPSDAGQTDAVDGLLVHEHFVPTPTSISPEARDMLRSGGVARPLISPPASPDDDAGWKAYWQDFRAAGDGGILAMAERYGYAARYPAKVDVHRLSASTIFEITPEDLPAENCKRAIYYVHGGGFALGGGAAAVALGIQMAGLTRCKTYAIDYRMVPEVAYPVPLEDIVEGYRFILERTAAPSIAVYGPSAGANLAPAMLLMARDQGLPMPAACALHSSPSDLSDPGDTAHTNMTVDVVLRQYSLASFEAYAGNFPDRKHPHLSPLYGDYSKGFPPTILVSGTRDLLLSGTVRLHRAMLRGGVEAELHIWEAMTHAPFIGAPEEDEFHRQLVDFMLRHMAVP